MSVRITSFPLMSAVFLPVSSTLMASGTLNHALPVAMAAPRSVEPTPVEKPLSAPYVHVCESAPIVSMPGATMPFSGRMTCSMPTRPCSK